MAINFTKRFYKNYGKNDDRIRLISVQSAKGGVGKTTFSLLMGNQILEHNKKNKKDPSAAKEPPPIVILMDLDFGGTSLSDMIKDDLIENDKNGKENKQGKDDKKENKDTYIQHIPVYLFDFCNKDKQWNLINLFNKYLEGERLNKIISKDTLKKNKTFEKAENKLLIIPSGRLTQKGIINGNLLFDSLHVEWFCEFIFTLIFYIYDEIQSISKKEDADIEDRQVYCIFDNGPGWSELLPALQKYMVKWGVHRAKFLQVASLDKMDIDANLERVKDFYNDVFKKYYCIKGDFCNWINSSSPDEKIEIFSKWLRQDSNEIENKDEDKYKEYFHELIGYYTEYQNTDNKRFAEHIKDHLKNKEGVSWKISNFMAIVFNKVFNIIKFSQIDSYINNKDSNGQNENVFSDIPSLPFKYDPAIALIYQDIFIDKEDFIDDKEREFEEKINFDIDNIGDGVFDKKNDEDIEIKDIIYLDSKLYKLAIMNKENLLSDQNKGIFLTNKIINETNFEILSHLFRMLDVFSDIFLCTVNIIKHNKFWKKEVADPSLEYWIEEIDFPSIDRMFDIDRLILYIKACLREWSENSAVWSYEMFPFVSNIIPDRNGLEYDDISELVKLFQELNIYNAIEMEIEKSSFPKAFKVIFEFYFSIFSTAFIYQLRKHNRVKRKKIKLDFTEDQASIEKEEFKSIFQPLLKKLIDENIELIKQISENKSPYNFKSSIIKSYDLPNDIFMEINNLYFKGHLIIKSFKDIYKKNNLNSWIESVFKNTQYNISSMGEIYIKSLLEDTFRGYRDESIESLKETIRTLIKSYYMKDLPINHQLKRLGNTAMIEYHINSLLNQWGYLGNEKD